ncbi:MAG: hypothetical protein J7L99_06220, partial [Planctomycetes bacterium]|nr:hypothetical protein [Planctomycetota bacterium]
PRLPGNISYLYEDLQIAGLGRCFISMQVRAVKLDIYQVSIPMRRFEHAAASRCTSEGIIVRLELSDGSIGWGEAHPRKYVTGETLETSVDKLKNYSECSSSRKHWIRLSCLQSLPIYYLPAVHCKLPLKMPLLKVGAIV